MSWRVPFVDFPLQFQQQESELMALIREVLGGGDLIMRSQMRDFEENLAAFVGTKHAVGVSNCTDAIRLFAEAYGTTSEDEVISVAHTFVATISPFKLQGATPVLVDVGADHLMDVALLATAVTDRTRFIVPVHLNGRTCDMDEILAVAERSGAIVLEDAAQALGARYRGRSTGTFGRAAVYSFYPAKLLGALGDAGALVTDDDALAEEIRLLRDHGRRGTELVRWAYNCRLDNLQAAILDVRLKHLPAWIERRRELAARYDAAFQGVEGVRTLPGPDADPDRVDVYQNYPILVEGRDDLVSHLGAQSIETLTSWPVALHHQAGLGLSHHALPNTESLCERVVSLPLFPELRDEQVDVVADEVIRWLG